MYQPTELAIYIHWPFCKSKCPYCDFFKEINPHVNQHQLIDEYIKALEKYHTITSERKIKSVFFGGGTPSLIHPSEIARLLDFVAQKWPLVDNIEISLEANPNSHYKTMFADLKNAGINRLSLGVQALNEQDLRFLGRTHTLKQALYCLEEITETFDNHSADLIYARPNQTLQSWEDELAIINKFQLKHISLYQLTIEPGTVFAKKGIKPLNESISVKIYNITRDILKNKGYLHYEVSNFAKPSFQSRHNLTYWQGGDYLGIGTSAHGRLYINGQHIATEYPFKHIPLSNQERAQELVIMGMRLPEGINKYLFNEICGINFDEFINQEQKKLLVDLGLLCDDGKFIKPTYDGILLLDQIIQKLCC